MSRRTLALTLTAAAVVAVIGVAITFAIGVTRDDVDRAAVAYMQAGMMNGEAGMMNGAGMNGAGMNGAGMGAFWSGSLDDAERVDSIDTAKARAEKWLGDTRFEGFGVAEVMAFSNGYYVAVEDAEGAGAFELLVDPATGWVSPEPGPSMMWNIEYGMMGGRLAGMMGGGMMGGGAGAELDEPLSPEDARVLADRWLDGVLPGVTAGEPVAFPGYFTFDTERDGRVQGMLSVNAQTGAVWYHVWHGSFLDELGA